MKNNNEIARIKMLAGLITEGQYRKLITENSFPGEKSDLIDYTFDITSDEIDEYGTYDDGVFEVESGNDDMADVYDEIYDREATGMEWWKDDSIAPFLSEFYDYLLTKAAKEKYGDDTVVEYF